MVFGPEGFGPDEFEPTDETGEDATEEHLQEKGLGLAGEEKDPTLDAEQQLRDVRGE